MACPVLAITAYIVAITAYILSITAYIVETVQAPNHLARRSGSSSASISVSFSLGQRFEKV